MNEPGKILGESFLETIRQAVRDEIQDVLGGNNGQTGGDRLLTAEEASSLLSVSPDWLYRQAKKLPFTRKLGPKMLRFSQAGIMKWLETRRAIH
jgi:predicted DNA-binding transcriptional regulator AlpA